jgi:hypothetical protein
MRVDHLIADLIDGGLAVDLDFEVLNVELRLHHCVANGGPSYAFAAAFLPPVY